MPRLPEKVTGSEQRLSSDPLLSKAENFARFLSAFAEAFYETGSGSQPSGHGPFAFSMKRVRCQVGRAAFLSISPFALSLRMKRNPFHGFREICFAAEGEAFVQLEGTRTHRLRTGEALAFDPTEPTVISAAAPARLLLLLFPSNWFAARCRILASDVRDLPVTGSTPARRLFLEFLALLDRNRDALTAESAADELEAACCAAAPALREAQRTLGRRPAGSHDFLRSCAEEAMLSLLGKAGVGLSDIARAAGFSRRTLSVIYREVGTTAGSRLTALRLERAATELRLESLSGLPVEEIGRRSGFPNASHFGRLFKRRYGATPLQWRLRLTDSAR